MTAFAKTSVAGIAGRRGPERRTVMFQPGDVVRHVDSGRVMTVVETRVHVEFGEGLIVKRWRVPPEALTLVGERGSTSMENRGTMLRPGDVVRLKSGGPAMTVWKISGASGTVHLKYFAGQECRECEASWDMLIAVDPDAEIDPVHESAKDIFPKYVEPPGLSVRL